MTQDPGPRGSKATTKTTKVATTTTNKTEIKTSREGLGCGPVGSLKEAMGSNLPAQRTQRHGAWLPRQHSAGEAIRGSVILSYSRSSRPPGAT